MRTIKWGGPHLWPLVRRAAVDDRRATMLLSTSLCAPAALLLLLLGLLSGVAQLTEAGRCSAADNRIDVCIIGAGGSGAFAAVKLRQAGHSVLVVDRSERASRHHAG